MLKNIKVLDEELQGGIKYATESMDGVYYVHSSRPLVKGEEIIYSHEGTLDLLKVRQVGNATGLNDGTSRLWGDTLETADSIITLSRQNYVELEVKSSLMESECAESELDTYIRDKRARKTHYLLETDLGEFIVELSGRLNKGQTVHLLGEGFYRVSEINQKTREVKLAKVEGETVTGLYQSKLGDQVVLTSDWGTAWDVRVLRTTTTTKGA